MFMVGGGILMHGTPHAHEWIEHAAHGAGRVPGVGRILEMVAAPLLNVLGGSVAGAFILLGTTLVRRVIQSLKQ
jgi:predicted DNA repair protein MutK